MRFAPGRINALFFWGRGFRRARWERNRLGLANKQRRLGAFASVFGKELIKLVFFSCPTV